jgi:hypothetical protein
LEVAAGHTVRRDLFRLNEDGLADALVEGGALAQEGREVLVLDRDVEVEVAPFVGLTAPERAGEPGGADAGIAFQRLDDAG